LPSDKIVLRVDHNTTYVQGRMDSHIYDQFKKELGYLPENAFWMVKNNADKASDRQAWKKDWDGIISAVCWNQKHCHCHIKKKGLHFHSGLLSRAVSFFKKNNIKFQRIDIRKKTEKTNIYSMSNEFEIRDYQQSIIKKIVGSENQKGIDRGIIKMATGSGKCPLACSIIAGIGVSPTIFYVPSIDLLKQAKDEIERFVRKDGEPVEVGMIGGGNKDIKDITVMTIQTAVRALGGVWVKFDEEDVNKDDADIGDIKEDIKNLIHNSRLMIGDECLEGDALIKTKKGDVNISEVLKLDCKYVLSYDGNNLVWKKITAFMPKGKRKVLKITLISGKQIRCTSNHPFMNEQGWIESDNLSIGGKILTCEQKKDGDTFQSTYGINLEAVVSVEDDGHADVFDIEVEYTHCFFANNILVHNCQHWSSETCQIISDSSYSCQYRYFMSATPFRDQGDDILIEACAGKTIADINASFLIKKGFLIKPKIYFSKINNMRGMKRTSYANVYKQAIVENEMRNNQIVLMAKRFYESGRKILILVKQIAHGNLLEKLIPESIFLHGSTSKKKREKHLDLMRKGLPQITITSIIFDEGINCRPLDTLILGGGGKSATRALQRIGRILRPHENKQDAIVVDFMDNCKYMQSHSKKRADIYKTEEEFDIEMME